MNALLQLLLLVLQHNAIIRAQRPQRYQLNNDDDDGSFIELFVAVSKRVHCTYSFCPIRFIPPIHLLDHEDNFFFSFAQLIKLVKVIDFACFHGQRAV